MVSKNSVMRIIFGPKREEVVGGFIRLHNEKLHTLYASLSIIKAIKSSRMIWAGYVAWMGGIRNAYYILIGKLEGKRPLEDIYRWENNIRMSLRETGWKDVDWIHVAQDRDQW